ncbi:MAG: VOC family protein [Nitrospirae bacterium]|nr:VOC family protein [Nitrospirota bacterium]
MRYKGVSHVALATRDMGATIRFWRDLLGLRMVLAASGRNSRMYFFHVANRQYIGFFEWPGIQPITEKEAGHPASGPFAFDHFALAVASDDDLFAMKDRLNAAGIWVSEVLDHGFIHSIYTFDPNGISVEFSADTNVDIVTHPHFADSKPLPETLEGAEPVAGRWPAPHESGTEERVIYPGFGAELKNRK